MYSTLCCCKTQKLLQRLIIKIIIIIIHTFVYRHKVVTSEAVNAVSVMPSEASQLCTGSVSV